MDVEFMAKNRQAHILWMTEKGNKSTYVTGGGSKRLKLRVTDECPKTGRNNFS